MGGYWPKPSISSHFDQPSLISKAMPKHNVKMIGYWPKPSRCMNAQKKNRGQYLATSTNQAWSVKLILWKKNTRGRTAFNQHRESWPPRRSNTGSPWFRFSVTLPLLRVKFDNLIGQEYETIILRMLRKLDLPRGRDSWCWPKGARPLGTRMSSLALLCLCLCRVENQA